MREHVFKALLSNYGGVLAEMGVNNKNVHLINFPPLTEVYGSVVDQSGISSAELCPIGASESWKSQIRSNYVLCRCARGSHQSGKRLVPASPHWQAFPPRDMIQILFKVKPNSLTMNNTRKSTIQYDMLLK